MDALLTSREVARILGVSETTAKIWAANRKFPVIKIGRLVRVAPEALEEWIREKAKGQGQEAPKPCRSESRRRKTGSFEDFLGKMAEDNGRRGPV